MEVEEKEKEDTKEIAATHRIPLKSYKKWERRRKEK